MLRAVDGEVHGTLCRGSCPLRALGHWQEASNLYIQQVLSLNLAMNTVAPPSTPRHTHPGPTSLTSGRQGQQTTSHSPPGRRGQWTAA